MSDAKHAPFVALDVTCPHCHEEYTQYRAAQHAKIIHPTVAPVANDDGELQIHYQDADQVGISLEYALGRTPVQMEYPERERVLSGVQEIGTHLNKTTQVVMSLLTDIAIGGR